MARDMPRTLRGEHGGGTGTMFANQVGEGGGTGVLEMARDMPRTLRGEHGGRVENSQRLAWGMLGMTRACRYSNLHGLVSTGVLDMAGACLDSQRLAQASCLDMARACLDS
ncbi:hypothetical protein JCGZ_10915 [Jatropha curcas]|uniref:Uncharacterized protein n=1 Tax=Jatropha curcas TaxID=180498 RepID=A0A067KR38_JATCU|nr:hypothetical protein JCGZ_10915 [Jatropha curcas]